MNRGFSPAEVLTHVTAEEWGGEVAVIKWPPSAAGGSVHFDGLLRTDVVR